MARKVGEADMNARQAAKAAAKRIEQLEDFNRRATADNKAYNLVIEDMIHGKSPCPWCLEFDECEDKTHGCENWSLKMDHGQTAEEEPADESKGILSACPGCGG